MMKILWARFLQGRKHPCLEQFEENRSGVTDSQLPHSGGSITLSTWLNFSGPQRPSAKDGTLEHAVGEHLGSLALKFQEVSLAMKE